MKDKVRDKWCDGAGCDLIRRSTDQSCSFIPLCPSVDHRERHPPPPFMDSQLPFAIPHHAPTFTPCPIICLLSTQPLLVYSCYSALTTCHPAEVPQLQISTSPHNLHPTPSSHPSAWLPLITRLSLQPVSMSKVQSGMNGLIPISAPPHSSIYTFNPLGPCPAPPTPSNVLFSPVEP